MTERDIFIAALQKEDPAERRTYLDEACAQQPKLRIQVENLLRLYEGAGSFLEKPAAGAPATGALQAAAEQASAPETPGAVIGPYKLIEQIGEGGMGAVWMAQQTEPVKRLVAVKLIKAGMDSRQVIARFEAERQALALMDHVNIARVLDAGTTTGEPGGVCPGRPYFVMDLVKGVPITRYCDEHHLTPRQRLELFIPVCQAIQHAHHKGIIHRDLKPSNVLVALYDGRPVPKVIDFGVAKAAGQTLTDKTLVTGFGAIVGTLEYMSPEQAEINQLDIDTRSDIYSLGVLLYELLTGSPPFSRKELEKAGMLEMLRVIREREPSKPSTKLSTAEGLPTLAANRGTEPGKLTKLVRGELDWIVMKALEKDRNRRYETANGFAMDVQRYLSDEAVQACPPSVGYKLRKFVRRNKGPVLAASLVLAALLVGIIGTSAALVWAVRERDDKAKALIAEQKARGRADDGYAHAQEAVELFFNRVTDDPMLKEKDFSDLRKKLLKAAVPFYDWLKAQQQDSDQSRAAIGHAYYRLALVRGDTGEAEAAMEDYRHVQDIFARLAADFPTRPEYRYNLAETHVNLGNLLGQMGRLPEAESAYGNAQAIQKQLAADFPIRPEFRKALAHSNINLGNLLRRTGRLKGAETAYADALAVYKQLAADFPDRPEFRLDLATTYNNLGLLLSDAGRLKEAETALAAALAVCKQLAAEFPTRPEYRQELAYSHHNQGLLFSATDRLKEAETAHVAALALRKQLAADFPSRPEFRQELAYSHHNLGLLLSATGRLKAAETAYADALALCKQLVADFPTQPDYRQDLAGNHNNLGSLLYDMGRLKEAEIAYAAALALLKKLSADFTNQPDLQNKLAGTCVNLAILELGQRNFKAAKRYLEEGTPHHEAGLKANPRNPLYRLFYRNNLEELIRTNAGLGDREGATRTAEKLRDLGWDPTRDAYDAACYLSLCIPIIQRDDKATKEERDKQVAFYGDQALKMLRAAVAKGYKDAAHMKKDTDLDPLRRRDDFKKLLVESEGKSKE